MQYTYACRTVRAHSPLIGELKFEMMTSIPNTATSEYNYGPNGSMGNTGRQVYEALRPAGNGLRQQSTLYLYHILVDEHEGLGRWVIGTDLGSKTHAVAYIDSWAVTPYTASYLNDNSDSTNSHWFIQKPRRGDEEASFTYDTTITLECASNSGGQGQDNTIYFDSSVKYQPHLTGFYVETAMTPVFPLGLKAVYAHIRSITSPIMGVDHDLPNSSSVEAPLYMYKLKDDTWMIGHVPNVDNGLAFHDDSYYATTPGQIHSHHLWRFVSTNPRDENIWNWSNDHGVIVSCRMIYNLDRYSNEIKGESDTIDTNKNDKKIETSQITKDFENIYASLLYYRSVKHIPAGQQYITLRNKIPLPSLGYGTGGVNTDNLKDMIRYAVDIGYRTFDLAREYRNERVFAHALEEIFAMDGVSSTDDRSIKRHNLYLISKVWPTELGFEPTTKAIQSSCKDLQSNYIDMYLLHWPHCNPNIDWMHCQDTIQTTPPSTWKHAWRALERAYSEGKIMGIGVSNFDVPLLIELGKWARIAPQLIQNHATVGTNNTDIDVRIWARKRNIVYMPYAHQRNLATVNFELKENLLQLSEMHGKSEHNIVNKFMIQSGAAIIPRSENIQHMRENADVFSYKLAYNDMLDLGWDDHYVTRRSKEKEKIQVQVSEKDEL